MNKSHTLLSLLILSASYSHGMEVEPNEFMQNLGAAMQQVANECVTQKEMNPTAPPATPLSFEQLRHFAIVARFVEVQREVNDAIAQVKKLEKELGEHEMEKLWTIHLSNYKKHLLDAQAVGMLFLYDAETFEHFTKDMQGIIGAFAVGVNDKK